MDPSDEEIANQDVSGQLLVSGIAYIFEHEFDEGEGRKAALISQKIIDIVHQNNGAGKNNE